MSRIVLMVALVALWAGPAAAGSGKSAGDGCPHRGKALDAELAALPAEPLGEAERAHLLAMFEEEVLARDVYRSFAERWPLRAFERIAAAEQRHVDHLLVLVDRYELERPPVLDEPGAFSAEELARSYRGYLERGERSMNDALRVGAEIEEADMRDITVAIEATDNADLALAYQNLLKGSRNHLRAYDRLLAARDVDYEPLVLPAADYEAIVTAPRERGRLAVNGEAAGGCTRCRHRGEGRAGAGQRHGAGQRGGHGHGHGHGGCRRGGR
jgi:hypothetical protein